MAFHFVRNSLKTSNFFSGTRYAHQTASKFASALKNSQAANLTELENGVRVISEKTSSPSTTVGIWLEAGTSAESKENNGIINFVQNLMMRGSKNVSKKQLENYLHSTGGLLNSYTDRETSGILITSAPNNIPEALDILSNLIKNPTVESEDVEMTRKSVLKQLNKIESNYEQVTMDYLHSVAYQNTSLAYSKYGPTENIQKFTKTDVEKALDLILKGTQIVVAASGNVDHDQIVKLSEKNLKSISNYYEKNSIPSFIVNRYTGSDIRVRDDAMNCAHVAFAVQGPGYKNPDSVAMDIISSLMGKWDLTHGGGTNVSCYMGMVSAAEHLAQSFQSFNLKYKDTALWGSYFVGERMQLEEMLWQLQYQWKRYCVEVANNEIRQGKNALMTKLISQREGSAKNANSLAKDILRYGQRISLEDWEEKINRINSSKVHSVAEEYIWDRCPVVSAIGPVENLPLYEEIRMKMSWIRY